MNIISSTTGIPRSIALKISKSKSNDNSIDKLYHHDKELEKCSSLTRSESTTQIVHQPCQEEKETPTSWFSAFNTRRKGGIKRRELTDLKDDVNEYIVDNEDEQKSEEESINIDEKQKSQGGHGWLKIRGIIGINLTNPANPVREDDDETSNNMNDINENKLLLQQSSSRRKQFAKIKDNNDLSTSTRNPWQSVMGHLEKLRDINKSKSNNNCEVDADVSTMEGIKMLEEDLKITKLEYASILTANDHAYAKIHKVTDERDALREEYSKLQDEYQLAKQELEEYKRLMNTMKNCASSIGNDVSLLPIPENHDYSVQIGKAA